MDLYFDSGTYLLYLLPSPENDEQLKVEDFDIDNIKISYNII